MLCEIIILRNVQTKTSAVSSIFRNISTNRQASPLKIRIYNWHTRVKVVLTWVYKIGITSIFVPWYQRMKEFYLFILQLQLHQQKWKDHNKFHNWVHFPLFSPANYPRTRKLFEIIISGDPQVQNFVNLINCPKRISKLSKFLLKYHILVSFTPSNNGLKYMHLNYKNLHIDKNRMSHMLIYN